MRILLIHRHFWPDTPPYAAILRSIGKRLAEEGHEVLVFSTQPSYKPGVSTKRQPLVEPLDGMTVYRVTMFCDRNRNVIFRLINMVYFPACVFLFVLFKRPFDFIMASTAPPVVVGFAAALSARLIDAKFFYHCMDIHPEIGRISGEFKNPFVFKVLQKIDQISCRFANRVIVLSKDMKNSLLSRSEYGENKKNNIEVINNFSMPHHGNLVKLKLGSDLFKQQGRFRVLFAGNMGRFQGLEAFIDAMAILSYQPNIELVFLGEGSALDGLKIRTKEQGLTNIHFLPHQSVDIARAIIGDADLGIVSLTQGIYKFAYPSKTMTYLDEGCPLLVSIEPESELVKFVENNRIGISVLPNNSKSISVGIESLYLDSERHIMMKLAAKKTSEDLFTENKVLDRWFALFNSTTENNKCMKM